jgi:dihydroflavonol-4-reductase
MLVRNPARVPPALDPHGVQAEVVVGDMTDEAMVRSAVADRDAVIHAAAQVGVSGGGPLGKASLIGAQTVIGAAIDAGVRRIVFTSSVMVHLPTDAPLITIDAPLSEPMSAYGAMKVETERLIQQRQDAGHPITTVVLGGIYGPHAPDLINSFTAILSAVEQLMVVPPGGTTVIDVRDVALLLTRIVESDNHVPRVLAGGHFIEWADWVVALERVLGLPAELHVYPGACHGYQMAVDSRSLDRAVGTSRTGSPARFASYARAESFRGPSQSRGRPLVDRSTTGGSSRRYKTDGVP